MTCLAKSTEAYFTDEQKKAPCDGPMLDLGNFWMWHPSGVLTAEICERHAALIQPSWSQRSRQSYLGGKIQEARAVSAQPRKVTIGGEAKVTSGPPQALCITCGQPFSWAYNGVCVACDPTGGGCLGAEREEEK